MRSAADSWRPVRRSQLRAASCVHLLPAARSGVLTGLRSPASANAHSAYRGGVPMPCGRHLFASLCATSTTTSTSLWDENAAGCLIWRRYRRLAGRHAVWMSAPGPADRPQARAQGCLQMSWSLRWYSSQESADMGVGSIQRRPLRHRQVRSRVASAVRIAGSTQGIRSLDSPLHDLFECSNSSRSCHRPGAKMGSHSAKSRQESGGVWTVCRSNNQLSG